MTSGPQRSGCELVALAGVDPVPGGRSHDCCVLAARPGPVLEPGLEDLDGIARQVDAGLSSKRVAGLDGRDAQPAADQGQGGLSRSGANLQDPVARLKACDLEEPVEQQLGVVRPGVLIEVGGSVKRHPQTSSVVGHHVSLSQQVAQVLNAVPLAVGLRVHQPQSLHRTLTSISWR